MRNALYTLLVLSIVVFVAACGGKKKEAPPQETPAQAASQDSAQEASAPQVRADVPLLDDAAGVSVATAADGYAVTYTSGSDMNAVAAFYQEQMPPLGWTYYADISSQAGDVSRVLAFSKASEEAAVTLSRAGGTIQVTVAISPQAAAQAPAADTPTPPPPTATPAPPTPTPSPPAASPAPAAQQPSGSEAASDIPLMADASEIVRAAQGAQQTVTYKTGAAVDDVVQFYSDEMPRRGWTYMGSESGTGAASAAVYFTRSGAEAGVSIVDLGLMRLVTIAIQGATASVGAPAQPAAPSPTDTPAPPAQSSTSAAGREDIPIMPDAVNLSSGGGESDFSIIYASPSALDAVVEFYKAQMPAYGWAYRAAGSTHVPGVTAVLYFDKAGNEATITITLQNGATSVEIVIH